MSGVFLIEVGTVDRTVTAAVAAHIGMSAGVEVSILAPIDVPAPAWDPDRRQYAAVEILRALLAICPEHAYRMLAITECDLYIPVLSFVFGQAQLGGRLAVMSLARLRQEFYGLPPHAPTLIARAFTEAIHELGHTFGLVHCADPACAMSLAIDVRQVDRKRSLCAACAGALRSRAGEEEHSVVENES